VELGSVPGLVAVSLLDDDVVVPLLVDLLFEIDCVVWGRPIWAPKLKELAEACAV
jgi:hypothetical protein